jgi:Glycine rich protein
MHPPVSSSLLASSVLGDAMRIVWALVVLVVLCVGAKLCPTDARAAEAPVTVSFSEVGAHTLTVPVGVTSVHVVAVGAPGGDRGPVKGGRGATATADLAVTPGQVLGVFVGGAGGSGEEEGNPGGFNGGGEGGDLRGLAGGGGGGASDVRTGGPGDLASRLVVAAGGGGAGRLTAGADAGQSAASSSPSCGGAAAGTASAGGKGGTAQAGNGTNNSGPGGPGALGVGGVAIQGGGGGGGLFGGGGGGGVFQEGHAESDGCGGGGGSSGFGPATSATATSVSESRSASVTISYVAPAGSTTPPTAPPSGGSKSGGSSSKAGLSLPVVQHGKAVVGTVRIGASRSALKAKLLWRKTRKSKQLVLGNLTEAPLKKGLHSFTVKLNGMGKGKLAKLGLLKLTLSVAVTPPQGVVAKASKPLKLKP